MYFDEMTKEMEEEGIGNYAKIERSSMVRDSSKAYRQNARFYNKFIDNYFDEL